MDIDNLDEENNQAPENQENLDNTSEDYAKIERYKQQVEGSKQEALRLKQERILDWSERLTEDASSLELLEKKDHKLALEVAKNLGYSSIEEMKEENGLTSEDIPSENISKKDLEKWYEERKAKDIHDIAISEASKIFNDLDESSKDIAKAKFEKLTKGQILSIDEAKDIADMAYLFATKGKISKKDNGVINLAATGLGKSKVQSKGTDTVVEQVLNNW